MWHIFPGCSQVPKLSEGADPPQEVLGALKHVCYKTEIVGGVPIVRATQVRLGGSGRAQRNARPIRTDACLHTQERIPDFPISLKKKV